MNDKKLGYILIFLLLCAIISVLGYAVKTMFFPKETRIISFNQVGNLRIDDPVKLKGLNVGTINSIKKGSNKVLVIYNVDIQIDIHEGYRIITSDKGIMGDRVVHIEPGDSSLPLISKNDTLTGEFKFGVSEALGAAWKMRELVKSYNESASLLLSGSKEKPSLISLFYKIIEEIDTFTNSIYNASGFFKNKFPEKIERLEQLITSIKEIIPKISNNLPENIDLIEKQVGIISTLINKLDKSVSSVADVILTIQKNDSYIESKDIDKLSEQLEKARSAIQDLHLGIVKFRGKIIRWRKNNTPEN